MIAGVANLRVPAGLRGVYRSAGLHKLTDAAAFATLGIGTVVDFRAAREIEMQGPDLVPGEVHVVASPIGHGSTADWETLIPQLSTPEKTEAYMEDLYRMYVSDAAARGQIAGTLRLIAGSDRPVLFHCSAGKDRTGFVAAILQSLLGVPLEEVYDDYLASIPELETVNAEIRGVMELMGIDPVPLAPILGVQRSFLDAAFDQIAAEFGTVAGYAGEGLGLGADVLAELERRLLAQP